MDIYNTIATTVLRELESGRLSWRTRWKTTGLPLRWCGTPYRGINALILWAQTVDRGYASPYWLMYNHAIELEGHVSKGEKATAIVYGTHIDKKNTDENDDAI